MAISLQPSAADAELNAFLFASVGEDKTGVDVTVLSALARVGLDPWGEAARLASLPSEAAALALTKTIGLLPIGNWTAADVRGIAARLVACLPRRGAAPVAPAQHTTPTTTKVRIGPTIWMVCAIAAIGWFFVSSYLESDAPFESAPTVESTPSR